MPKMRPALLLFELIVWFQILFLGSIEKASLWDAKMPSLMDFQLQEVIIPSSSSLEPF